MNKKICLLLIIFTILLTACDKELDNNNEKTSNSSTNKELIHEHCTRDANAGDGIEVNLNYDLYYKDDVLYNLISNEQIVTNDKDTLDEYEDAYNNIHSNYKELEYYDAKTERTSNSVTSIIDINYDKIDIDKLIEIEGEEDNIFENKIPKVTKWKELAEKFGTKCTRVD